MNNHPTESSGKKRTPALALAFAFLPVTLVVFELTRGQSGPLRTVLWTVYAVNVVCCFASAFLLIRCRTRRAMALGKLFVVLSGGISMLLGCVALFKLNY